jgi:hypothetical protein
MGFGPVCSLVFSANIIVCHLHLAILSNYPREKCNEQRSLVAAVQGSGRLMEPNGISVVEQPSSAHPECCCWNNGITNTIPKVRQ